MAAAEAMSYILPVQRTAGLSGDDEERSPSAGPTMDCDEEART
jgi:hypothetical protein